MDPFKVLSGFEIAQIVEYLHSEDIVRLQLVNRCWRETLNSNFISRVAFLHHFPSEAAGYRRFVIHRGSAQPRDGEGNAIVGGEEVVVDTHKPAATGFDFTAAFRKALQRYMNLCNATPYRARTFSFRHGERPRRRGLYTKPWEVSGGGGIGPEYIAWVVDECVYSPLSAWGGRNKLPMLTIIKLDGTRSRSLVPMPEGCRDIVGGPDVWNWKMEADFVKILDDVVVVRSEVSVGLNALVFKWLEVASV